jgi:hypothetical protein
MKTSEFLGGSTSYVVMKPAHTHIRPNFEGPSLVFSIVGDTFARGAVASVQSAAVPREMKQSARARQAARAPIPVDDTYGHIGVPLSADLHLQFYTLHPTRCRRPTTRGGRRRSIGAVSASPCRRGHVRPRADEADLPGARSCKRTYAQAPWLRCWLWLSGTVAAAFRGSGITR